ncbi:TPA: hypothetical protein NJ920_004368 [Vibrio parahaemolyticus]|nr:hypothetical protein [Vibrio parahaemolyticus]HCG9364959.1 hypothetical protein [Vibrio parahaemolyticus]HCH4733475.1 hypothetical protein [Vibrio parahaemolyticus]
MNIRIRGAIDGIARYFQKGKKGKPRDEWDTRIAVHGDLDVFQTDIDIINTQHNWTQAYKHITFGISPTDEEWFSKLSDEDKAKKIDELTRDWLKLYVPQYKDDIDKLNWYSEIHIPKKIYDENGNRRWPHAHLALSLLDPFRGKRLRVVSFSEEGDLARQTHLANKHGFVLSKEFARDKDRDKPFESKKGNIHKNLANYLKENGVSSIPELRYALGQIPNLTILNEKKGKLGYFYVQITTKQGKDIRVNLNGGRFEFLTQIYADHNKVKLDENRYSTKHAREHRIMYDKQFRDKIINHKEMVHLEQVLTKKQKTEKEWRERYSKWIEELDKHLDEVTKVEKNYFMLFGCNLRGETLGNTAMWRDKKNPSQEILYNKDHKLFLVKHGGVEISCDNPLDTDERRLAAAILMIETGISANKWDLEDIVFYGDDRFKEIANKELMRRIEERKQGVISVIDIKNFEIITTKKIIPTVERLPSNSADTSSYTRKRKVKAKTERIKTHIKPNHLLHALKRKGHDVSGVSVITITNKHGVDEVRFVTNGRKRNAIDFVRNVAGLTLDEAIRFAYEHTSPVPQEFSPIMHEIELTESRKRHHGSPRRRPNRPNGIPSSHERLNDPDRPKL